MLLLSEDAGAGNAATVGDSEPPPRTPSTVLEAAVAGLAGRCRPRHSERRGDPPVARRRRAGTRSSVAVYERDAVVLRLGTLIALW